MSELTIVMYHYVRPIKGTKYSGIKGLELEKFKNQLNYLQENFNIISAEEVVDSIKKGNRLRKKSCWLTFDDGYKDHYEYVFPELLKRGIQGSFFPPSEAICSNNVLDVNVIHHVLANTDNVLSLKVRLEEIFRERQISDACLASYEKNFESKGRWDDDATFYIKSMLQYALPDELRFEILSTLFQEYVGQTPEDFSSELYMSPSEVRHMVDKGMYVGSHGATHIRLGQKCSDVQMNDIKVSLEFLDAIGSNTAEWIMCYPYGSYAGSTLSVLRELGALVGLTTEVRTANLDFDNPLLLPRFDTNDFPQ